MNVQWAISASCERTPSRSAVVADETVWDFSELWARSLRVVDSFFKEGLKPGDRILVGLRNTVENVAIFVATQISGIIYVPFNYRTKLQSTEYLFHYADARLAILEPDLYRTLLDGSELWQQVNREGRLWIGDRSLWQKCSGDATQVRLPSVNDQDLSMLLFTSGTTGNPKGIPLTHNNVVARTIAPSLNWGCPHDNRERVIGILPLYHTIGIQACLLYSVVQNHTYYPVAQFTAKDTLELIQRHRITHCFGTPTHLYNLINDENLPGYDVSSLTHVLYGGAPMSPHIIGRVARVLCPRVTYVYGNTETYNVLYHREAPIMLGEASCGVYHNVRVVKFGGSPGQRVDTGQEGELIVDIRSPESFRGYWRLPEKTEEKIRDGWYYTGDSCVYEGENRYRVTGRVDDMIISGGENIQPVTVENAILGHPDVLDVAVSGIPDDRWGQTVQAFVVCRRSMTESELDAWMKESSPLDAYMRPRRYRFVDEIPRNPSGKILRKALERLDQPQV